jgi:hypothetical protein
LLIVDLILFVDDTEVLYTKHKELMVSVHFHLLEQYLLLYKKIDTILK